MTSSTLAYRTRLWGHSWFVMTNHDDWQKTAKELLIKFTMAAAASDLETFSYSINSYIITIKLFKVELHN